LAINTFSGSEGMVDATVALIPKHPELSGGEGGLHPSSKSRWRDIDVPVAEPGGGEVGHDWNIALPGGCRDGGPQTVR
jgi:hypothetical protein